MTETANTLFVMQFDPESGIGLVFDLAVRDAITPDSGNQALFMKRGDPTSAYSYANTVQVDQWPLI